MTKSTGSSWGRFVFWLTVLVLVPAALLALYWLATLPDVSQLAKQNPKDTALIQARRAQSREEGHPLRPQWTWVPMSRISPYLQRAVVATEDASFFMHEGFDWEGIKDAAVHNLEAGEFKRGGSTITQQLAKNLYLSAERSLLRKAREALITRSLEHHLTKRRILELYLNVAEWGNGIFGAEAAARHHFGKPASDLNHRGGCASGRDSSLAAALRSHEGDEVSPLAAAAYSKTHRKRRGPLAGLHAGTAP